MYKTLDDFPVWRNALQSSTKIFRLSDELPRKEDYGLTSQLRRSANSIGANIAEGFGRRHKKDKINFYIYARGSAYETIHHLTYGLNVGYFDREEVKAIVEDIEGLIYELNKMVKAIKVKV